MGLAKCLECVSYYYSLCSLCFMSICWMASGFLIRYDSVQVMIVRREEKGNMEG